GSCVNLGWAQRTRFASWSARNVVLSPDLALDGTPARRWCPEHGTRRGIAGAGPVVWRMGAARLFVEQAHDLAGPQPDGSRALRSDTHQGARPRRRAATDRRSGNPA